MSLGVKRKEIKHQNDKGEVCNALKKGSAIKGLIDEDPQSAQPKYISGLHEISRKFGIRVLIDKNKNILIVLQPRLEDWIIKTSLESKVDPSTFSLSSDPSLLHKEINFKLERFEELIAELLSKKNGAILHLKSLLNKK